MLVLPHKAIDDSSNLFQVGLRSSNLMGIEVEDLGLRDRIWLSVVLGAVRIVWQYISWVAKDKIKSTKALNSKFQLIDVTAISPAHYSMLRKWRDKVNNHVIEVEKIDSDQRFLPAYLNRTLDNYRAVHAEQVSILDQLFSRLDRTRLTPHGFTSIQEAELWEGRSKAYDYLA